MEPSKLLNFVTFNIHKGLSPLGRRQTLSEIRILLESVRPDIICLQEIGSRFIPENEALRFETQLEYLATTFWPHRSYQKNASYPSGHHGNAILSRWPIIEIETVDLSLNDIEKRGLLHAKLELEQDRHIHVLCTHLNLLEFHRTLQLQKILTYLEERIAPDEQVIFSGDFNDWRKKIFFNGGFEEAFLATQGRLAKSFPSLLPMLPLDRIYYRGLRAQSAEVVRDPRLMFLSDHLPLQAKFEFF